MELKKSKLFARIPLFFWIGLVLIIGAIIVGGFSLAVSVGYRYLAGLIGSVVAMFIFTRIRKRKLIKK